MATVSVRPSALHHECAFVSAACVNCVRWSNNGLYLASGGDDKLVMVWKRAAYVLTHTHTHRCGIYHVVRSGQSELLVLLVYVNVCVFSF